MGFLGGITTIVSARLFGCQGCRAGVSVAPVRMVWDQKRKINPGFHPNFRFPLMSCPGLFHQGSHVEPQPRTDRIFPGQCLYQRFWVVLPSLSPLPRRLSGEISPERIFLAKPRSRRGHQRRRGEAMIPWKRLGPSCDLEPWALQIPINLQLPSKPLQGSVQTAELPGNPS